MRTKRWEALTAAPLTMSLVLLAAAAPPAQEPEKGRQEPPKILETIKKELKQARKEAPKELPGVPPPDPRAAQVPAGFRVEVVAANLEYPTSVEFDDRGGMYVAEAGYYSGDSAAHARVLRIMPDGSREVVADGLNGPVTDLLWHDGRMYVSHRGKISAIEPDGSVRDLVTDLPSLGDHHNNQMAVGPDGKIYFGQGTATNSGVVGLDSFKHQWLQKHPNFHDLPAHDIKLSGQTFRTPNPLAMLNPMNPELKEAETGAFQPFGEGAATDMAGTTKASGTILRMNPDGSGLVVYAWGLRNPFGVLWGPDGKLYVSNNGMDERGSRPVANAPDELWVIREGMWCGWPDYVAGEPVTEAKFKSGRGPQPQFVMADHPEVEKPLLTLNPHVGAAKLDFSRGGAFGQGVLYLALAGDMKPMTAPDPQPQGFQVVRIDPNTGEAEPFFRTARGQEDARQMRFDLNPGPRRPIDVRFSPAGDALYIADGGVMIFIPSVVGPMPRPYPGSGVIWRVVPVR